MTRHEQPAESLSSDVSGHHLVSVPSGLTNSRAQEKIQFWLNNIRTARVSWEKMPLETPTACLSAATTLSPDGHQGLWNKSLLLTFRAEVRRTNYLRDLSLLESLFLWDKRTLAINHIDTAQSPVARKTAFFFSLKGRQSFLICFGLSKLDL